MRSKLLFVSLWLCYSYYIVNNCWPKLFKIFAVATIWLLRANEVSLKIIGDIFILLKVSISITRWKKHGIKSNEGMTETGSQIRHLVDRIYFPIRQPGPIK